MYVVNGSKNSIDIFNAADPNAPVFMNSVDLSAHGNPNSVDINPKANSNEIALAVNAPNKTDRGRELS